jgi:hypothetical protein
VPNTLVVDDSSWIEWLRVFDFYDDHPYGNNRWWPGKLASFKAFIAERGAKPLLLGECIAADTWLDREAWRTAHADADVWWAPRCLEDQPRFEQWVEREFGGETLARLAPESLAYGMRNRKYQIERLRLAIPDAGYVVSVMRDFTLARMGLYDDLGGPKWSEADWAWHGDTMLCLDTEGDARALPASACEVAVRVSHFGRGRCSGRLTLSIEGAAAPHAAAVDLAPGDVSARAAWRPGLPAPSEPRPFRLAAELTGDHPSRSAWDLWLLPPVPPLAAGVKVVQHLDADTLAFLRGGGRVLHLAGDRKNSIKTEPLWFLRGAVLVPPHPAHREAPAPMLAELQAFDLEAGRVIPGRALADQVDTILGFWDTHDLDEVRFHLLAFDTRVGEGRLLVSALDHDTPAGRFVLAAFARHLAAGAAPRRELAPATIATLAAVLEGGVIDLPRWRMRTDPDDRGVEAGFAAGLGPEGSVEVAAGKHWESQGFPHYDGVAWFSAEVEVPAAWRDRPVTAVFEGVDDSFTLFVNGAEVARFGDPATKHTVWLERVSADVAAHLRFGERNCVVLRVVDHAGAGGIWRPVYLTTGGPKSDLLR